MNHILSAAHLPVLERFATSNPLFAFDFDGTLAPIHADPAAADMRPRTRVLLSRVASLYACAVVSGRAQADVAARVDGLPLWEIVGNHGLEPWAAAPAFEPQVQRWRAALERALAGLTGVFIEDKRFSLAIHFRHAPEQSAAAAVIRRTAAALDDVRLIGGKCVVNLVPSGAPDKGTAVEAMRERLGCATVVYVGDDASDEDVFARGGETLLGISVEPQPGSRAAYHLREQAEIDDLLTHLVELALQKPLPLLGTSAG